jgi:hypothetical protein
MRELDRLFTDGFARELFEDDPINDC